MRRFAFVLLCVFCLAGAVALTSCESEPEIPADEPITKTVTFTIHNKTTDSSLTISSIKIDEGTDLPGGGWESSSVTPGKVETVNRTIAPNTNGTISVTVTAYKKYQAESGDDYSSWEEYPRVAIDCHYGNDSSAYPYTGYLYGDEYGGDEYGKNAYKTSEASCRISDSNTFHFVKTDAGDYILATAN